MARKVKDYPSVSLEPEDLKEKIDFAEIFGRVAAVHVEIGSGKGTFLVNQASAQPDVDFLGIEWARKYYRLAVDRIGRWKLGNVRIIRTDAAVLIRENIADESVDVYHIYFPDPWPKKRHHKRRLLCPTNLDQIIRTLKPGGQIRIATDHADYFEVVEQLLADYGDRLELMEFERPQGAADGEWAGTNFERKYIVEGRPINAIAARRI